MKYYEGTELKWSTEDVLTRAKDLDIELTEKEAEIVLIATFDDNEYIMEVIGDVMKGTILEHIHNTTSK
jgi:hypothetical protein